MLEDIPNHISGWMQANLPIIGDKRLGDYMRLPGTHDSGIDHLSWNTWWGTENRTVTQRYGIGDQLRLGARWFDLRPMWNVDQWSMGHAGFVEPIGRAPFRYDPGWQGGTGAHLHEVIQEINQFTSTHAELIVLRVTHINNARDGSGVDGRFSDLVHQLFTGIKHVYLGANGTYEPDLQRKTLKDFIGDGIAKVVISAVPIDGSGFSNNNYADLDAFPGAHTDFNITKSSITASLSSIEYLHGQTSLLIRAAETCMEQWPATPKALWEQDLNGNCGVLEIDGLHDCALLTICLAASHAGLMRKKRVDYGGLVIVYGGKFIENSHVKDNVLRAIQTGSTFQITNDAMGGEDPWPNRQKCCVVHYLSEDGNTAQHRFAWEGSIMAFDSVS